MDRWVIAGIVVALVLAAWWASRAMRETTRAPRRLAPEDFGLDQGEPGNAAIVFTAPYCLASGAWLEALDTAGTPYVRVNVDDEPELARRYGVRRTPLVVAVRRASGEVAAAYAASQPAPGDVSHISALVAA